MPQDVFTLQALAHELHTALASGHIDRISQPEKDEVFFYIRKAGRNCMLVVSANPNGPRIHLTDGKKDNPYAAPAFLMHLRKHLQGGTVRSIALAGCDRIVRIDITGRNEMYDAVAYTLYIELMGRYSNIIVTDEQGIITDALRHIVPDDNQLRAVLPKLKYQLPPMSKLRPTDSAISDYLAAYSGGNLAKYLIQGVSGFATSTAYEVIHCAGLDDATPPLSAAQIQAIVSQIERLYHVVDTADYAPCYTTTQGMPDDFFVYPYTYSGAAFTPVATLNLAVDICASAKDKAVRLKNNARAITAALQQAIKKQQRALSYAQQRLIDCRDMEHLRIAGDLITNNLYLLHRGQSQAEVYDYYHDTMATIALDARLSPADNAQAYYKKYAKQKRTQTIAAQQIEQHTATLEYLAGVQTALALCEDSRELVAIQLELQQGGYMRTQTDKAGNKNRRPALLPPLAFNVDGYTVLVGKNNHHNELLTWHTAKETDLWLHVQKARGSHVIIQSPTAHSVPEHVVCIAAELAAYYSELRQSDKVTVDCTPRRNVKRHPSKQPGMVLYTQYQSVNVAPNAHTELQRH